jgi:hypothetical protein
MPLMVSRDTTRGRDDRAPNPKRSGINHLLYLKADRPAA